MLRLLFAVLLCGCLTAHAYWQPAAPATPPENPSPAAQHAQITQVENLAGPTAPAPSVVLREGQEVVLRNVDPIVSNKSKSGETVQFEVIRAISSDGVIVIPEHGIAVGTVLTAEHAKLMHHGARLIVAIESVQLANGEYARCVPWNRARRGTSAGETLPVRQFWQQACTTCRLRPFISWRREKR